MSEFNLSEEIVDGMSFWAGDVKMVYTCSNEDNAYIEVEDVSTEDLLKQKEAELLRIYEEIQNIKNQQ